MPPLTHGLCISSQPYLQHMQQLPGRAPAPIVYTSARYHIREPAADIIGRYGRRWDGTTTPDDVADSDGSVGEASTES